MPHRRVLVHSLSWALVRILAAAFAVGSGPGAAQNIYRCGPQGNVYSQAPCADGRLVDTRSASRSPAQLAQAQAEARETRRIADQLARDRTAFEAAHPPRAAAGIHPPPAAQASSVTTAQASKPKGLKRASRKPTGWRPGEGEDFVASAPAPRKKKTAAP